MLEWHRVLQDQEERRGQIQRKSSNTAVTPEGNCLPVVY